MFSFIRHLGAYGAGFTMVIGGVVSYFHIATPGIEISDPVKTIGLGIGIIAAAWKADTAMMLAKTAAVLLVAFMLSAMPVRAADILTKASTNPLAPGACLTTDCIGPYIGFTVMGQGGNAAVIQNGIGGSIFAGGGLIGVQAGYELWNGSWFISPEIDALLNSTNSGSIDFSHGGFVAMAHLKLGGNAGALLGSGTPAPSQGPISIPGQLLSHLVSPYLDFCTAFYSNANQQCGGAGVQFSIGGQWTADMIYDYGAPTKNLPALNYAGFSIGYHFK